MVLEVENLRDTVTDALITGADVSARVFDDLGSPVTGVPDPVELTEVVGGTGLYRGTIPDTAAIVEGDSGTIVLTADGGAGLGREWTLTYTVRTGIR
jgi:hypothetical protein